MTHKLTQLRKTLTWDVENCKSDLAKWTEKFTNDPSHALEWSENTFFVASKLRVAQMVLAWAGNEETDEAFASLQEMVNQEAMRLAGRRQSSTSAPSNLYNDFERVAWVDMVDRVAFLAKY